MRQKIKSQKSEVRSQNNEPSILSPDSCLLLEDMQLNAEIFLRFLTEIRQELL